MVRATGIAGLTGGRLPLVTVACAVALGLAATVAANPASAGHDESVSTVSAANALVVDRLTLVKFSNPDVGPVSLSQAGEYATLSLQPDGSLVTNGPTLQNTNASFTAVFSLAGSPNQTFGISLPSSIVLSSGANSQSVRAFLHDAGPVPVLGDGGVGRFNVGALLSVGRTGTAKKTQVYMSEIHVIVSNN